MPEENTRPARTPEEILGTITAARDSVWVIDDSIAKIAEEGNTEELKGNLERNVGHLRIVTSDPEIVNSGNDIEDLLLAIEDGEAALAAWPA